MIEMLIIIIAFIASCLLLTTPIIFKEFSLEPNAVEIMSVEEKLHRLLERNPIEDEKITQYKYKIGCFKLEALLEPAYKDSEFKNIWCSVTFHKIQAKHGMKDFPLLRCCVVERAKNVQNQYCRATSKMAFFIDGKSEFDMDLPVFFINPNNMIKSIECK